MADPKIEPRTDSRTTRAPRPLPPKEDDRFRPVITPGLTESRTVRDNEPEEGSFRSGETTTLDAEDIDRGYATRATPPGRTQTPTAKSRGQREWEQGPIATADQAETDSANTAPLFSDFEIDDLRSRWNNVQAGFVDSPRHSVQKADELVAVVMQRLTDGFADERNLLERQWDSGDNVSTEDLRVALQRYRSFFGRLLNVA